MDLTLEIVGLVCLMALEGVAVFAHFRTKLAKANQEIEALKRQAAETQKVLAEKDLLLEQRDRTIAERDKLIEEAHGVRIATEKARLEVQMAHFSVQDKLAAEAARWKDAEQAFADDLEAIARAIHAGEDASLQRSQAIKRVTGEVLDSFSVYLDKAVVHFRPQSAEIISSFLVSDVVAFVVQLDEGLRVLNDPNVLANCATSREPLILTSASLGAVERCLLQLLPLSHVQAWSAVSALPDTSVGRQLHLPPVAAP
ncbi:MAG: hypothetical protein ACOZNI_00740 [Myxococcota bacterium]